MSRIKRYSCIALILVFASSAALAAPPAAKKSKMDVPTISCGGSTPVSIDLTLTAGSTGAPAGISIQWMTLDEYVANGNQWYASESVCKASFSGNANLSRYTLGPAESVTVNAGEFLSDSGASYTCGGDGLACGTQYVFRAFAHADSKLQRSDFTADKICATAACNGGAGCTYTQGYWKNHGPIPTGNNSNEWPVFGLTLGSVWYSDLELQAILDKPAAGNGLIALAHQLIAAKLNVENGADDTDAAASIAAADALIGARVAPPVGSGSLSPGATSALTNALATYNEGGSGPGHCD